MSEQTYVKDQVYSIKVKELQPDPDQPRKYIDPDRLEEMSKSILQHGILQPLLFRVDKNGQKIIVAGERRYQASMKSGLEKVPCLYTDGNAPVTALIENIIRENLTAVEEAEAIEKLRVQNDYTHEELSEVIGKSRSAITETLKINSLPEEIKNDCRNISSFPKSVLVSLNDIENNEEKLKFYNQYKKKEITRDEIRRAASDTREQPPKDRIKGIQLSIRGLKSKIEKLRQDWTPEEQKVIKDELKDLIRVAKEALANAK